MAERRLTPGWRAPLLSLRMMGGSVLDRLRLAPAPAIPEVAPRESAQAPQVTRPLQIERPTLRWRAIVLQAGALWLVTRIAFVVLTYFGVLLIQRGTPTGSLPIGPHEMLNDWKRWDVIWYINIASMGYWRPEASAFFPLYPLLIKGATLFFGQHWLFAAMVVSNLGTLAAFIGLALWASQDDFSPAIGVSTVRMVAAYPYALFLFAGYSDSLFLALVAFTFFFLRRASWRWAIVCGVLAGLERPTAFALVLPMLWEYGRQHGWWDRARWERLTHAWRRAVPGLRELAQGALVAGAVPIGFAFYGAFLLWRFGHPKIFLFEERIYWHHTFMNPVQSLVAIVGQIVSTPMWTHWQAHQLLDFVPVAAFAVLTVVLARRMPLAYTLYMVVVLLLSICSPITEGRPDLLTSAGRYMLAALPIFLQLGRWAHRYAWLDMLLVSTGFMVQAVLTVAFLRGDWII